MRDERARAAFVAEACGDDADLRREVDSLLARASDIDDFLNGAAADLLEPATEARSFVGDCIGPYAIECRLGAGGMGDVYRARDRKLDRDVAIKILPPVFTTDAGRIARFEREARILAALNHPRIGAIYGLEHIDGLPALILELVDGPTLAERLAGGSPSLSESVAIAVAIAEALEAAHDRGIIHRDIKPANIKLTPAASVKVLDFGLAKDVKRHDEDESSSARPVAPASDLSSPGSVLGTFAYMSPEQARGDEIDARTDLFSLGTVLYEMVTGHQPFVGAHASRIIDAIAHTTPPLPRLVNPAVPHELERVIVRLLEPRREARYQTASEVRADLTKVATGLDSNRAGASRPTHRRSRAVVTVAATVIAGLGGWMWFRAPHASRVEYTQITQFADSATWPALSPDGRLLTFIRGASTFKGPGQVYLKELPDGDPVPLTSDRSDKMSPVFSPDGSRIAYTSVSSDFVWDTWVVPLAGRAPRRWLTNASGLTWVGDQHLLFSEITAGLHMHVVAADDRRREPARVIYSPDAERGMAHLSYPSPDGAWVLIAEMVQPMWQPCRLVAMNGRTDRRVGPQGQCTSAAWSPDGKWMYFSSNSSGSFHIWRQRFPDGPPEQISFGPGEEEGVAVSPDGQSLLTSIGNRQSSIYVRDASGEREVSREGYAFIPEIPNSGMTQPFSVSGRLLYLVRRGAVRFAGPGERAGELWQTDLQTSQSEALFPGFRVSGYDVSRDGNRIAFAALDERGMTHIWMSRSDRQTAPRQVSGLEADNPRFGGSGSIFYRVSEGGASFIYRMSADGESTKAVARPVLFLLSVSPDDAWLVARVAATAGADSSQETVAFPTSGGPPVRLCGATCEVDWTPNAQSLVVRLGSSGSASLGRTFVLALRPGETLPPLPPHGIETEADMAGLQFSQAVGGSVYPADVSPLVAFVKSTTVRNIYRIALP